MSKVLEMHIPSDQTKINTNDLCELIWWCAHLDIGPEKLLLATEKVGNSVEKIRIYFLKFKTGV